MILSRRRDAELLQQVLDGAVTERTDLADLASLAGSLPRSRTAPDPAFLARLRDDLVTAQPATTTRAVVHTLSRPRTRPALPGLVAAVAALVLVSGLLSSRAVPGELLYPVKLAIGAAQVRLASDDTSRGRALLAQVERRIGEVESLVSRGDPRSTDVATALGHAIGDLAQAQRVLLAAAAAPSVGRRDGEVVRSLAEATAESTQRLQALRPHVPAASLPLVVRLLAMLGEGRTALLAPAWQCGAACAGLLPLPAEGIPPAGVDGRPGIDGTVGGGTAVTGVWPSVSVGPEPGATTPTPGTTPGPLRPPGAGAGQVPAAPGPPTPSSPAPTSAGIPAPTPPPVLPAPPPVLPAPLPAPALPVPLPVLPVPVPLPVPVLPLPDPSVTAVPTVPAPAPLPLGAPDTNPGCVVSLGGSCVP